MKFTDCDGRKEEGRGEELFLGGGSKEASERGARRYSGAIGGIDGGRQISKLGNSITNSGASDGKNSIFGAGCSDNWGGLNTHAFFDASESTERQKTTISMLFGEDVEKEGGWNTINNGNSGASLGTVGTTIRGKSSAKR